MSASPCILCEAKATGIATLPVTISRVQLMPQLALRVALPFCPECANLKPITIHEQVSTLSWGEKEPASARYAYQMSRVRRRIAENEHTLELHPDPVAQAETRVRIQAYKAVLEDMERL